jgi:3-methyladenine DNA glycosylase Tag
VEVKKKKPYYGKIFQEFDRKGVAMLKATIGYRGAFDIFDKL